MVQVRKATPEDFQGVYAELLQGSSTTIDRESWRRIFSNRWALPDSPCGYILEDDSKIVGYLGLIFSRRRIDGATYPFCNLTTWQVKPEYRAKSLSLLLPVLSLKGHVLTNLTGTDRVREISTALGFQMQQGSLSIFPFMRFYARSPFSVASPDVLSDDERAIYDDHQDLPCRCVVLADEHKHVLIVYGIVRIRSFKVVGIHYISNIAAIRGFIDGILRTLCLRERALFVAIDGEYYADLGMNRPFVRQFPRFKMWKTDIKNLDVSLYLDSLYSELILLNRIW